MDVALPSPGAIEAFFLVWVRASTLLLAAPMFGMRLIPPPLKLALGLLLAALLTPLLPVASPAPAVFSRFLLGVAQEVLAGLLLAFAVTLIFGATQFAGALLGLQFGFSLANVVDPTLTGQETVIGQFYAILTGLVFFTINGHHLILIGLARSFEVAPPHALALLRPDSAVVPALLSLTAGLFAAALRIAMPITGALLLADVAMAIMSRSAPQMNVYFVGLPIKILIGFAALLLALPLAAGTVERLMSGIVRDMLLLLGKT